MGRERKAGGGYFDRNRPFPTSYIRVGNKRDARSAISHILEDGFFGGGSLLFLPPSFSWATVWH